VCHQFISFEPNELLTEVHSMNETLLKLKSGKFYEEMEGAMDDEDKCLNADDLFDYGEDPYDQFGDGCKSKQYRNNIVIEMGKKPSKLNKKGKKGRIVVQ
jgi:hypothetical protein